MSWAVPNGNSGYRVYAKGASEIILERVVRMMQANGDKVDMTAEMKTWLEQNVISHFASEAMRTIGLAFAARIHELEALHCQTDELSQITSCLTIFGRTNSVEKCLDETLAIVLDDSATIRVMYGQLMRLNPFSLTY